MDKSQTLEELARQYRDTVEGRAEALSELERAIAAHRQDDPSLTPQAGDSAEHIYGLGTNNNTAYTVLFILDGRWALVQHPDLGDEEITPSKSTTWLPLDHLIVSGDPA